MVSVTCMLAPDPLGDVGCGVGLPCTGLVCPKHPMGALSGSGKFCGQDYGLRLFVYWAVCDGLSMNK